MMKRSRNGIVISPLSIWGMFFIIWYVSLALAGLVLLPLLGLGGALWILGVREFYK